MCVVKYYKLVLLPKEAISLKDLGDLFELPNKEG